MESNDQKDQGAILAIAAHRTLPVIASSGSINKRTVQFWFDKLSVDDDNDHVDDAMDVSGEK
jgi:hypothetical protein